MKTIPVISRELELGLKPVNLVKPPITPALVRLKQDASETRSKRKKKNQRTKQNEKEILKQNPCDLRISEPHS